MLRLLVHRSLLTLLLVGGVASAAPPLVSPRAVDLIIRYEVISPSVYTRRYSRPVWPGGASGVTVGIGYDLGFNSVKQILHDWSDHPQRGYLAAMSGFTRAEAQALAARRQFIVTPYPLAYKVFLDPTLIRYYNITRRAFPGMENLDPDAQGALVSLVYNRGGNMVGKARSEMRTIRDVCIPARDNRCVAGQFRAMIRIWRGGSLEKGMTRRRYEEAELAEG